MSQVTVCFTIKEVLQQVERELAVLNVDTTNISLEKWKQYIIARVIEDVLLIDIAPLFDKSMATTTALVCSNYRRVDGEDSFTIHQDVGTNKLFPYISSSDLSFESELKLRGHCVFISSRKVAAKV